MALGYFTQPAMTYRHPNSVLDFADRMWTTGFQFDGSEESTEHLQESLKVEMFGLALLLYYRCMNEQNNMPQESEQENLSEKPGPINRRQLLKYMGAVAVGAGLGVLGVGDMIEGGATQEDAPYHIPKDPKDLVVEGINLGEGVIDQVKKEVEEQKSDEYWRTSLEQGLMICAKKIAEHIFEEAGIPEGNAQYTPEKIKELMSENPVGMLLKVGVLAPLVEETLFRFLPSKQMKDRATMRWGSGIAISALFAMIHNFSLEKKDDETFGTISFTESVPITQFMGGLFYWYLMRKKGVTHAMLAHSENNIFTSVAAGLDRFLPAQKEKQRDEVSQPESHPLINVDKIASYALDRTRLSERENAMQEKDEAAILEARNALNEIDSQV